MFIRSKLALFSIAALTLACSAPTLATEAFVVNRAEDLRFVPLRESFVAVRSRIEGQVDLMDRLRRQAFKRLSDEWGVPPADKKDVSIGCVARTDTAGNLAFAVVLRGEIEPAKIQAKLLAQNTQVAKKRGFATDQQAVDAQGNPAMRFPYFERDYEYTLVPLANMFVLHAARKGDTRLLDEVLTVLKAPDKLGQSAVGPVVVEGNVKLTDAERKRVTDYSAKAINSGVSKIRDRFRQLHDKLRPGGAKDEDLKSLDERINEIFLKATDFDLKFTYIPGPTEIYRGKYVLKFAAPDDAAKMRELMLEKQMFFRDNASNASIPKAVDTVTLDAQGNNVTVRVELDTLEKRHDASFSYLAFLLSFQGADADLGVNRAQ